MMIAETGRQNIQSSRRSSASVSPLPPAFLVTPNYVHETAGEIRCVMPKKRDREVPYGMKGGEH